MNLKTRWPSIFKALFVASLVTAVGFELGIFQRAFDSRSIVEDGVVGADFWIIAVDGKPTVRIQHGLVISKVPFALLEPGNRAIRLSVTPRPSENQKPVEFKATIEKGVHYRISKDENGNPELVAKK
ncbi:hypothetical protein [Prosthecobacter fluviatilis]|uniref:Uncharacterized protein n=1 Tax=Prosthecobacter fluviatilis TaxID=445931 RepID=A0ABW0KTE8_9BACT